MYIAESGDKDAPAIVFIHGGGISGWMWRGQVTAFQDYHCIVPDLPEHGKSMNESPITIANCADRLAELIKSKVQSGKAHLVGHSIGAKIIVEMLSRHSDVVDHAVIVSALFRPITLLNLSCNRLTYRMSVSMLKHKRLLDFQVKQFGFLGNSDRLNLSNDFKSLTVDSLDRIYGELFKHLKLPLVRAMPHAKGILFKGSMHDIPWKAADDFNKTIREWIDDKELTSDKVQGYM
jgi:pimeloyl-ACP methyl ester carboxylesterase